MIHEFKSVDKTFSKINSHAANINGNRYEFKYLKENDELITILSFKTNGLLDNVRRPEGIFLDKWKIIYEFMKRCNFTQVRFYKDDEIDWEEYRSVYSLIEEKFLRSHVFITKCNLLTVEDYNSRMINSFTKFTPKEISKTRHLLKEIGDIYILFYRKLFSMNSKFTDRNALYEYIKELLSNVDYCYMHKSLGFLFTVKESIDNSTIVIDNTMYDPFKSFTGTSLNRFKNELLQSLNDLFIYFISKYDIAYRYANELFVNYLANYGSVTYGRKMSVKIPINYIEYKYIFNDKNNYGSLLNKDIWKTKDD